MSNDHTTLPVRRRPASGVWISFTEPTIVFVTVCTKAKRPWLAQPLAHELLLESWKESDTWAVGAYVVMPDHVHFFCSPRCLDVSLRHWVTFWKGVFRKKCGHREWEWQSGFWDTRLRRSEHYGEKWEYVRLNPVRKGLAARPEDWPYTGVLEELRW